VEFVAFLFAVACLVWLAAALVRFGSIKPTKPIPIRLIPALTLGVVLSGSVLGAEFFSLSAGPIPITFDRLLFLAVIGVCGLFYLTNHEDLQPLNWLDMGVIAVIAVLTYSTLTHDHSFMKNLPLSRLLFFNLMPFGVYLIARTAKTFPNDLKLYRIGFAVFAIYLAITGLLELKGLYGLVWPRFIVNAEETEFLGRARGPFLNPVSNGFFLICGLCCTWFWWPKSSQRGKFLIVIVSLLLVAGMYATLTRSVWMALILVGFLLVFLPAKQHIQGALVIAGVVALLCLGPILIDKIDGFKRDKEVSASQMKESAQLRPLFFTVATRMFQDRPILGCGFGQYPREKYPYLQDPYSGQPLSKTKSYMQHNVFLAYLTETGLLGLMALIAMLGLMIRAAWNTWRRSDTSLLARQQGMLLGALLATYISNGMFHDVSIMPLVNMLLFFWAGVANNVQCHPQRFAEHSADGIAETAATTTAPNIPSEPHTVPATSW